MIYGRIDDFIDSTTPMLSDSEDGQIRSQRWDSRACFSVLCFMSEFGALKKCGTNLQLLFSEQIRLFTS